MYHDSVYSGHIPVSVDTTSEGGVPTIAHYIKKIFLVSDNDAFNRLYDFVGQRGVNSKLKAKGYNVRIIHRLSRAGTPDQNRHTEPVYFADRDSILFRQPMLVNDSVIVHKKVLRGKGYYQNGQLIRKPFDMSYRNNFPLPDQHEMLKALIFPESVPAHERFNLTSDDKSFVLKYMSQLPPETLYPPYYKDKQYTDAYSKFLLWGADTVRTSSNIRIFNKVGLAYGFVVDNAYIVDFDAGVEFMLSAVIYVNKDGIYNDDHYEYNEIGFPFMRDLGRLIYDYEKTRHRPRQPDLSAFRFEYDFKRD